MFIDHPFAGNPFIFSLILLRERMLFAPFLGEFTLSVEMLDTLIARIGLDDTVGMEPDVGFFEEPEIMATAIGHIGTEYLGCLFVDDDLAFDGMAFLLAGIGAPLSFFGRSTGDSEASTSITS